MAELATIARPYAEALFKSTRGGDTAAVSGWLDELAVIAADPQLARFADDPKVSAEQVFRLIVGVAPRVLPDAARNFLRVVVDNARLAALPDMARQYRALANGDTGTADAVVHSAYPIDEATLGHLQQALQRRFGRPLQLHVEHDPALIGGVRVVVGDEVLDTSVRARLEQMKQALAA